MAKRKTLPKDFEELLKRGDLAELTAVFAKCDLDARGGLWKQSALAFEDCPDALARWLVEQGANLEAPDSDGKTPLQSRSRSWRGRIEILLSLGADANLGDGHGRTALHQAADAGRADNVQLLLERGAQVDASDQRGFTPLEYAMQRCSNAQIERMASVAALLLAAGASRGPRVTELVTRIGTNFEFHRSGFNPDSRETTSDALDRLYAMFDVPPVPRRLMHDGKAPIVVAAMGKDVFQALWDLLVPPQGAARTVQGEVVRIAGRIAREIDGNGAVNWDADFRRMAEAWLAHVSSGTPLAPAQAEEAAALVADVKKHKDGDMIRMRDLAVAWVASNPDPVPLSAPAYRR